MQLPNIGDLITEGMGMYRVLARLKGTQLSVMSVTGIKIVVDYADSGYRNPSNAWRILVTLRSATDRGPCGHPVS